VTSATPSWGYARTPTSPRSSSLPGKIRQEDGSRCVEAFVQATDADNDDGLSLHELLQSFAGMQLAEAAPIVAAGLRLEPEP
jgi:hypothetical protein